MWEELEGENQTVHSRHAFCTTKDYNSQDLPLSSSPATPLTLFSSDSIKKNRNLSGISKTKRAGKRNLKSHGSHRRTAARKDCDS
jgi:hypothetical protein